MATLWNRRQVIRGCAQVAAGVACAGLAGRTASALQLPPPEPLQDDRLTFVTTTEASAWQTRQAIQTGVRMGLAQSEC